MSDADDDDDASGNGNSEADEEEADDDDGEEEEDEDEDGDDDDEAKGEEEEESAGPPPPPYPIPRAHLMRVKLCVGGRRAVLHVFEDGGLRLQFLRDKSSKARRRKPAGTAPTHVEPTSVISEWLPRVRKTLPTQPLVATERGAVRVEVRAAYDLVHVRYAPVPRPPA